MPEPAPTPTPAYAAQVAEPERRIHPDFSGAKWEEAHTSFVKDTTKFFQEWPKKQRTHEVNIAKAANHCMCLGSPAMQAAKDLLAACEQDFRDVQKVATDNAVKGKNYISTKELQANIDKIESCRSREGDLSKIMKPLVALALLPAHPAKA